MLELRVAGVSTVMLPVRGNRLTRQHSFPSFLWLRLNITVLLSSGVGWEREEEEDKTRGKGGKGGRVVFATRSHSPTSSDPEVGGGGCFCCPAAP